MTAQAVNEVEALRHKLRMIVSHATAGLCPLDIDLPTNEICCLITETRNLIYQAGKDAVLTPVNEGTGSMKADPPMTGQTEEALTPVYRVTDSDRRACTKFDRSAGFLEGRFDTGETMQKVVAHRMEVEADTARRIFAEIDADTAIDTEATIRVYAAIKRAKDARI